jgi:hypothetical protein
MGHGSSSMKCRSGDMFGAETPPAEPGPGSVQSVADNVGFLQPQRQKWRTNFDHEKKKFIQQRRQCRNHLPKAFGQMVSKRK